MQPSRVRLGELLVRAGLLSDAQLEEALVEQARVGKRLGGLLVELGLVSETQVTQILSQQLSVPWVSLHHIDFSRQLLDLVPIDLVERFCLIPIYVRRVRGLGDALYVAMDDPTNGQALTEVAERSGLHVRAMIAPPSDIRAAIRAYYGIGDEPEPPPPAPARHEDDAEDEDVKTGVHSRGDVLPDVGGASREEPSAPATAVSPRAEAVPETSTDETPLPAAPAPEGPRNAERPSPGKAAGGARRMIALTFLDGTTIQLPGKGKAARRVERADPAARREASRPTPAEPVAAQEAAAPDARAKEGAPPAERTPEQLSARDIVAALRAQAHGADASEILGENVRWEAMFAALLSLLLKKKLISDVEFVEEFKKI